MWGESGVSCVLSVFSLPRIRSSSKTCRSWVSFPCCREQQQLLSNYIRCGHWTTCLIYCGVRTQTHWHTRLTHTSHKQPEGKREGLLCTRFCFFMVDLSQRLRGLLQNVSYTVQMLQISTVTFNYISVLGFISGKKFLLIYFLSKSFTVLDKVCSKREQGKCVWIHSRSFGLHLYLQSQ